MSVVFQFELSADVTLEVEDIWPDGDAPENPTVDEVLEVIRKCGGVRTVIRDWDLDNDLRLDVSGPDGNGGKAYKRVR
jgi:hypothetical protein